MENEVVTPVKTWVINTREELEPFFNENFPEE
jgi:hypothetical protein